MEELITLLPDILKYFVPGYLAILLFKSIAARKVETDITLIISCIISFVTIATLEVLAALCGMRFLFWGLCLASCLVDALLGITAALMIQSEKVKAALVNHFHITPNRSAISNVVDWENGSNAKIYFKDLDYYIIGHIYSIEVPFFT